MTKFINCTARDVYVEGIGKIPSSGILPLITPLRGPSRFLENCSVVMKLRLGDVTGLPAPARDTYYIVSTIVLLVLNGSREDALSLNIGPTGVPDDTDVEAYLGFTQ